MQRMMNFDQLPALRHWVRMGRGTQSLTNLLQYSFNTFYTKWQLATYQQDNKKPLITNDHQ